MLILDEANSRALEVSLRGLGYQVVGRSANGADALERIEALHPDLVLIQMRLEGGMDGIQVGSRISTKYDLPIIYVTDQSSQTTIRRSGGTGPFGYLIGPLEDKQILATIETARTRHHMEKRVRLSEQWLNAILRGVGEGIVAVDKDGRVQFMNPTAEILTARKSDVVLGRPLDEVVTFLYPNSEERVSLSHTQTGLQDQNIRTWFEASLVPAGGGQVPVEIFISPIGQEGNNAGLVLSFRDISERKFALREISRHAQQTDAMLKAAGQLNARLDVEAVLRTVCEICNKTLNTTATSAFLHDPAREVLISTTLAANSQGMENISDIQKFAGGFEVPTKFLEDVLSPANPVVAIEDIQALDLPIPYLDKIKEMDVRSIVVSGMYEHETLMGVLVLQVHGGIRIFPTDELELFRGLTDQATNAMGNALLFEQVVASRERQQALTRRLVDVQENERRNLARELHDQIGQMLTGLQFSLSALLANASSEQKYKIADIQDLVSSLIGQTREISMNLRPSMLDDTGLILTLLWHFDRYTAQTNIKVNFQYHPMLQRRLQPEIETTIYRIVQEALTNVARYAKTSSVDVVLKLEEQFIFVDIRDQGEGFMLDQVDHSAHMGLSSMRERAYAVGGSMEVRSTPGEGTFIHVIIPLSGRVERRHNARQRFAR